MKKMLILVLVLAFVSSATAASAWFEVDASDVGTGTYEDGDVLTINLVADFAVGGLNITTINANAGEVVPTALNVPVAPGGFGGIVNAFFNFLPLHGTVVNSGGVLMTSVNGGSFDFNGLAAENVLFTFEFKFLGTEDITITDGNLYVDINLGGGDSTSEIGDLVLTAPEPMTVALLGLGGLFLRRRK